MKNHLIITCIVLLQAVAGYAQNTFVFIDDKPDYQRPMGMIETDDAYIILNQYYYAAPDNQDHDYFLKLDKQGNKIKEEKIVRPEYAADAPTFSTKSILKLPNNNIALVAGYNSIEEPRQFEVYYAVYDQNFNKISDAHFPKPYGQIVPFSAFVNSKNNIILCGYIMPNPQLEIYNYSFIIEFTTNGELLHEYYDRTTSLHGVIYHAVEEADGSYLVAQQTSIPTPDGSHGSVSFCRFNSDLSLRKAYLEPGALVFDMAKFSHIIPKNDTSFLLVGKVHSGNIINNNSSYPDGHYLHVSTFDSTCQLLDYNLLGDTSRRTDNFPSYWQSADIDKTNPKAFFLSGIALQGLPRLFRDVPSTIWTYKYTTDGQALWLRKYGGADTAAYFQSYATYATSDGGVLLLNTRHAFGSGRDSDVHIIKYNKDGYLPVAEIDAPEWQALCYPNPASHQLHIDLPIHTGQSYQLLITDICGRQMINTTLSDTQNTIDISHWSAGVYTYTIKQGQNTAQRGKWVKR